MIDAACSVCLTAVADTVVLPCNHLVLCSSCCDLMGIVEKRSLGYPCPRHMPQQVPCPICRVTVQDRIKVFRG
ncbi:hypothetical protein DFH27DRAFT_545633 [Peziza echinospora]|nr:hypothetical protein DFH27DRAFT_545633 [Peziza echinospora]